MLDILTSLLLNQGFSPFKGDEHITFSFWKIHLDIPRVIINKCQSILWFTFWHNKRRTPKFKMNIIHNTLSIMKYPYWKSPCTVCYKQNAYRNPIYLFFYYPTNLSCLTLSFFSHPYIPTIHAIIKWKHYPNQPQIIHYLNQ